MEAAKSTKSVAVFDVKIVAARCRLLRTMNLNCPPSFQGPVRKPLGSLDRFSAPNVEFIVMPSKSGEINLGADRGAFYSTFYCSEARNFGRASWV